jgi:hypothetical protein
MRGELFHTRAALAITHAPLSRSKTRTASVAILTVCVATTLTFVAIALAVALAVPLASAATTTRTVGYNVTYTVENASLRILPVGVNGTRYIENGNLRLWKVGDCREIGVTQVCLSKSTSKDATFIESDLAAKLKATHTITTTNVRAGEDITGNLLITNDGRYAATNVVMTLTVQNATFPDGTSMRVQNITTIRADSEWKPSYRVITDRNTTVSLGGTVEYSDGNTTRTLEIANRTATVTLPFTRSVFFEPYVDAQERLLQVNLTRVAMNLSIVTIVRFPAEAELLSWSRLLSRTGSTGENSLRDRENFENDTRVVQYNITYRFTAPPTEPVTVEYRYLEAGYGEHSFTETYVLAEPMEERDPVLGFVLRNLSQNTSGAFTIVVYGNVTGQLVVRGALVNETIAAAPSTFELPVAPAPPGEYPVTVRYEWRDIFGRERSVNGTVQLVVVDALPIDAESTAEQTSTQATSTQAAHGRADEIAQDAARNALENEKEALVVTLRDPTEDRERLIWIVGGATVGTLLALVWLLHRIRDPLRRVEAALRKTAKLRRVLAERGGGSEEERKHLEELEEHLEALTKELR